MSSSSEQLDDRANISFVDYVDSLRIPYEDIELATNNFSDANLLPIQSPSSSSFRKLIYKGQLEQSRGRLIDIVARLILEAQDNIVFNELITSYLLTHKNILPVFKISGTDDPIIINKYEANESLDKHLSDSNLTWIQRLHICVGVAHALSYIHDFDPEGDFSVIHGNIKSSKILLDKFWEPKLNCFGFSMFVKKHQPHLTSNYSGALQYTDPAYVNTGCLTHECDVFSFGVVLFEVLFGEIASVKDEDNWYFAKFARSSYEKKTLDNIINIDLHKQMDLQSLHIFSETAYCCLKEVSTERLNMVQIVKKLEASLELQQNHESLMNFESNTYDAPMKVNIIVGHPPTAPETEVEVIKHAVKQVMQEVGPSDNKTSFFLSDDEKHDHRILTKLMSQGQRELFMLTQFPNQTFIYTLTAAYATYRYGTSPHQYLLEFTSEYGISEALHPKLPGPENRIVNFPEGKIHLSQLSVIDAAKVSHFEINCRQEAGKKYPSILYQAIRFPKKLEQPLLLGGREGIPDYCRLAHKCSGGWDASRKYLFPRGCDDTEHTLHPNPEATRSTTLLSRVESQILPGRRDMDLFSLICAPNPTKVKTGTCPRVAYEVLLLTVTASRVIEMEDPAAATDSSRVPSTIERSPLDFANENPSQQSTGPEDQGQEAVAPEVPPPENVITTGVAPEAGQAKGIAATGPHAVKERRKRGNDGVDTNAPPKVLRIDHADPRPTESTHEGKSLAAIELGMGSTRPVPASQGTPVDVSDPDPLSFADPQSRPSADVTQSSKGAAVAGDPESENTSFTSMVGSPESIYRPEWGITNGCLLDAPEALAMGSEQRLRFEQEGKLLKKSVAQVARRDKRIQAMENEIKNLEALLEAETDMKKVAEGRSAELSKELENMRALFSDLQVSNNRLSQPMSTLQEQVMGEEKLKSAFEEFKQHEDNRVEQRCAEIDARLDALSIDFNEELYLHMLTAIAGHRRSQTLCRQGIAKGMNEGLKHGVEHGKANLSLKTIEAYDPEAEAKYIAALHALKDLKYPIVDQLESLKDAPMDVMMASLYLESDTGDDALQWIRELRPSSSQLTTPVYPEACDPTDPWACKEEILLADAIAANISRAEKKKKCRVVCRTYGVGSSHHARSDGVSISVPTVAPQGLAILLADAATQTEISEDGASPMLLRLSSLPVMHN
uniref:Kinase-like domain-containing protein n=1 Tax=Tanacetum cinerariifolium TaxID=118510 RepID=A0A6L2P168_TANCI|nr:kinase-like domain-containing protein [Tanacetum cinerariifolium]